MSDLDTTLLTADEQAEYLAILEVNRRVAAKNDLIEYAKYIDIPGVPVVASTASDDDEVDPETGLRTKKSTSDGGSEEFYADSMTPALHHKLIMQALMRVEAGRIQRLMILAPPGTAKSSFASVVFPTWFMGKNPGEEIIKVTYGDSLARKFGRKCRAICKSKKYQEVFNATLSPGNGAADAWSITNGSSYMCGGVLSGITGSRARGLICDDVIKNMSEADSPTVQERTWEEYKSSLRTRIKPNGWQVIINTRWHLNDLSGHILPDDYAGQTGWIKSKDGEDWYVLCITAECVRTDDPLGRKIGEFLWTDWFSVKFWQNEKRIQGERNWNALYQQTPIPDGGSIFKREWFRLLPANREIPHLVFIVQSYDTAFTKESINDPTACTVWGVFKRAGLEEKDKWEYCVLLLDAWEKYLEYPVLRYTLKDDYKATYGKQKKRVNLLLIEEKGSGQSVIQDLRLAGLPIRGYNPGKASKETRAHIASPIVESGRVYLPESAKEQGEVAEWAKPFFKQVCSFPHAPNKDYTDTMTQLLIFLEHQDFLSLSSVDVNDPDEGEYAVEDKTDDGVSIYG